MGGLEGMYAFSRSVTPQMHLHTTGTGVSMHKGRY